MKMTNVHDPCLVSIVHPDTAFTGFATHIESKTSPDGYTDVTIELKNCMFPGDENTIRLATKTIATLLKEAERLNQKDASEILRGVLVALEL